MFGFAKSFFLIIIFYFVCSAESQKYELGQLPDTILKKINYSLQPNITYFSKHITPYGFYLSKEKIWDRLMRIQPCKKNELPVLVKKINKFQRDFLCVPILDDSSIIETYKLIIPANQTVRIKLIRKKREYAFKFTITTEPTDNFLIIKKNDLYFLTSEICMAYHYYQDKDVLYDPKPFETELNDTFFTLKYRHVCEPMPIEADKLLSYFPVKFEIKKITTKTNIDLFKVLKHILVKNQGSDDKNNNFNFYYDNNKNITGCVDNETLSYQFVNSSMEEKIIDF